MTEKSFTVIMIGLIFWLAFLGGVYTVCAVFCLLGMIAMISDEAKKEAEEEKKHFAKKEKTV